MKRKRVSLFDLLSVAVTCLLLGAALLCRYASDVSPETGRFWALLALAMPGVLLLNFAALLYWLLRRRWLVCLLPLAALVWNGGYVSAMMQPLRLKNSPECADLRVATLNAFNFDLGESRYQTAQSVAEMMDREQVDVLCVQEFPVFADTPVDSLLNFFTPYFPYCVQDGWEAILSRYPIVASRYARYADSWNAYLWTDLAVGDDTVRVISVHLQTTGIAAQRARYRKDHNREAPVEKLLGEVERNSRIRARQVQEIHALIDSVRGPLVLVGDFNDTPSSYAYRQIARRLQDGFRAAGHGYGGTFRSLGGVLRIDYIFCNDFLRCVDYRTLPDAVSDHRAVIADFEFCR